MWPWLTHQAWLQPVVEDTDLAMVVGGFSTSGLDVRLNTAFPSARSRCIKVGCWYRLLGKRFLVDFGSKKRLIPEQHLNILIASPHMTITTSHTSRIFLSIWKTWQFFHQVPMHAKSVPNTAVITPFWLFKFLSITVFHSLCACRPGNGSFHFPVAWCLTVAHTDGPFQVLEAGAKGFVLDVGGHKECISLDRLRWCYRPGQAPAKTPDVFPHVVCPNMGPAVNTVFPVCSHQLCLSRGAA